MEVTSEIIKIKPKTKYLSPLELSQQRSVEFDVPSMGPKRAMPSNTDEEKSELETLYEKLQKQLSIPRVERISGRAVAEWDSSAGVVKVIRKDGKFETFGYSLNGNYYLDFYEAIFLLEVNRLQLEYNSRILTIEQSYLLLMGEEKTTKYNEYLVYSHLRRVGYILVKHQNIVFQNHRIESAEDCVWAVLDAQLGGENIPDHVRKNQFFSETQKQYEQISNIIKNQKHEVDVPQITEQSSKNVKDENNELFFGQKMTPCLKRKLDGEQSGWHKAKRRRNYTASNLQCSLVDILKDEYEYKNFQKLFEKFDLVPLRVYEDDAYEDVDDDETLRINFDAYMHNDGFRKSLPHTPNFRVLILDQSKSFPTHKEIYFTYRKQLKPVPLLLVTVNESKQIQAFLYYFS